MKKIAYIIILFSLIGCEKIIDEKRELNHLDNENIWEDINLANLFLNMIYSNSLPTFDGNSNTNLSDESIGSGTGNMMYGLLTKDEDGFGNFLAEWSNIRRMNILLEEVDKGTLDEEDVKLLKGQTLFLRAWTYWEMVKLYGGVPLVLDVASILETENHMVARNSAKECVNQILADLDLAIEYLPPQWNSGERGRITRGAAAALKGRVLLFYASPQFNPDNLQDRWQTAYNANLEAKDICESDGYALYNDFSRIFLAEEDASEAIFVTEYDETNKIHSYDNNVRPRDVRSSSSASSSLPNWEFVESFPMIDGSPVTGHPDYDRNTFWKNRDPRLDATVAYNGMIWNFEGIDGDRIQWTFENNYQVNNQFNPITGFLLKKNVDASIPIIDSYKSGTDWIEIRLAEVYLNLAECAAELGGGSYITEAKSLIALLRERAGIEAGDGSYGITASNRDEMIEAVMLERKIELAFENKRYWDLRRRNMFINDLNNIPKLNGRKRHGIKVELDTSYIKSLDANVVYRYDDKGNKLNSDTLYVHFMNVIMDTLNYTQDMHNEYFNITFDIEMDPLEINYLQPKYNFFFIDPTEMEKNSNLQQTIYWTEINPFDPLAD